MSKSPDSGFLCSRCGIFRSGRLILQVSRAVVSFSGRIRLQNRPVSGRSAPGSHFAADSIPGPPFFSLTNRCFCIIMIITKQIQAAPRTFNACGVASKKGGKNMPDNRRVRMTKKLIKDAYLELLESSPSEKISVTDICKVADVNRSTFYMYYEDTIALRQDTPALPPQAWF